MKYCFLILFLLSAFLSCGQELKLMLPEGHTQRVCYADFSPDNKNIITASDDGSAKLWDVNTGLLLSNLDGHNDEVKLARYNSDGSQMFTAGFDGKLILWDPKTARKIHAYNPGLGAITAACYSPDGHSIVIGTGRGNIIFIDVFTGKIIKSLKGSANILLISFIRDNETLVSLDKDGNMKIWNVKTGQTIFSFDNIIDDISMARISPDGNSIAATNKIGEVIVWNSVNGRRINAMETSDELYTSLSFSKDGKFLSGVSIEGRLVIWNFVTGEIVHSIDTKKQMQEFVTFADDNRKIAVTYFDGQVVIWDLQREKIVSVLNNYSSAIRSGTIFGQQNTVVTTSNGTVKLLDFFSGKPVTLTNPEMFSFASSCVISHNGKLLAIPDMEGYISIWDLATHKVILKLNGHNGPVYIAGFSEDDKYLISNSDDKTAKIWDLDNGKTVLTLIQNKRFFENIALNTRQQLISTSGRFDSIIRIWSLRDGKLMKELKGHQWDINGICFNKNGDKILSTSDDGTAKLWESGNGKLMGTLRTSKARILKALFINNDSAILTSATDGILSLWNTASLRLIKTASIEARYTLVDFNITNQLILFKDRNQLLFFDFKKGIHLCRSIYIDETDFLTQIPTGYYQCTPDAARLLYYVTKDLKVITFEQLDVKYNRPDIVLKAIGNTDSALIKSYRKAWEKRIKKLGIDTTAFKASYSVPEADFVNRDRIEYEQKKETLSLHIRGNDSTYLLDRFNVWINEVPVYGQRGVSIRHRNKNSFDTTIAIKLSQGENRIETSLFNVNGTESYRMPLTVNYAPPENQKQKEIAHFIGIGIQEFADKSHPLKYSVKDIRDLALNLKEKYGNDITIDTLFNENVSIEKVKQLKEKLKRTSINDKVIIAYSGHGLLSDSLDYYLSTYSVNFNKPEENGLPYDELENLLDSIPARKKLMLIDACHSGEVDKEERLAMDSRALTLGLGKGVDPESTVDTKHLGLNNSFALMQSLFVNVSKNTGATIIAAAGGNQYALEGVNKLPNGVFTYCILEAMKNNKTIKVSELKKQVGRRVEEITKGLQKPTSRNETIAVDWEVWGHR